MQKKKHSNRNKMLPWYQCLLFGYRFNLLEHVHQIAQATVERYAETHEEYIGAERGECPEIDHKRKEAIRNGKRQHAINAVGQTRDRYPKKTFNYAK